MPSKYSSKRINGGRRYVHLLIAERALGKPLPKGAVVHHWDRDRYNNNSTNLLICQNQSYHQLIHQRQKSLEDCGHADWRKCKFCKEYDMPENLRIPKCLGSSAYHLKCDALYTKKIRKRNGSISFEERHDRWLLIKNKIDNGSNIEDLISEFKLSKTSIHRIQREGVNR